MDLEELNKQMQFFQTDFNQNNQVQKNIHTVNFVNPPNTPIESTQIKRPTKSGTHRNDINDKLSSFNMNTPNIPTPEQFANVLNNMPANNNQFTRNNTKYINANVNTNQMQQNINNQFSNSNHLAEYYNNNFSTLQGNSISQHPLLQQQNNQFNQPTNINTHDIGVSFVNPTNFYNTNLTMHPQNNLNENGYHRIDEKRIDFRQNMNAKVGNFIFDNPNASNFNPILNQHNKHAQAYAQKDTRMVIQDSSKDYYRQESNDRMAQYSPLARASNIPINIANMSVNDFYSNMSQVHNNVYQSEDDAKAVLNSRMNAYAPLAKTVQYQMQNQSQNQLPKSESIVATQYQKPKTWMDNNVNRENPLVAHEELPVISH